MSSQLKQLPLTMLITGNLLGVGVLALPIKIGMAGFVPGIIAILLIWFVMLLSGYIIADHIIGKGKHYNLPSFYREKLGVAGEWLTVICNLIILYGVITAYISGISVIVAKAFHYSHYQHVIECAYALLMFALILSGVRLLQKAALIIVALVLVTFIVLVYSGSTHVTFSYLLKTHWSLWFVGMPVAISAFHFQNIIPTVVHALDHDRQKIRKTILSGMLIGLTLNVLWVVIVLASLKMQGGSISIMHANLTGEPAVVPLDSLLKSPLFVISSSIFALLAVSASFLANGKGLYDFINDLCDQVFHSDRRVLTTVIAFLPPFLVALYNPNIFLTILDMVGGIGEVVLFIILPAAVMYKALDASNRLKRVGYLLVIGLGMLVFLYVLAHKMGLSSIIPSIFK